MGTRAGFTVIPFTNLLFTWIILDWCHRSGLFPKRALQNRHEHGKQPLWPLATDFGSAPNYHNHGQTLSGPPSFRTAANTNHLKRTNTLPFLLPDSRVVCCTEPSLVVLDWWGFEPLLKPNGKLPPPPFQGPRPSPGLTSLAKAKEV